MRGLLGIVLVVSLSLGGMPMGRACAPVEKSCCCPPDDAAPPPEKRVDGACCCQAAPSDAVVTRRTDVEAPRVERAVAVPATQVAAAVRVALVSPPAARQTSPPQTLASARILLLC